MTVLDRGSVEAILAASDHWLATEEAGHVTVAEPVEGADTTERPAPSLRARGAERRKINDSVARVGLKPVSHRSGRDRRSPVQEGPK